MDDAKINKMLEESGFQYQPGVIADYLCHKFLNS